jgi:hypothetical protein
MTGNNACTKFDWRFEIRIPGGGFAWDESDVKFEAPEAGYKEVVRYEHLATDPESEWMRFQDGRYFVRFPQPPPSGPLMGFLIGLHRESNFLAIITPVRSPVHAR